MSFGIDKIWRNKTIKIVSENNPKYILDVATGTGDLAFVAQKKLNPNKIVGLDISNGMLNVGRQRVKKEVWKKLLNLLKVIQKNYHLKIIYLMR